MTVANSSLKMAYGYTITATEISRKIGVTAKWVTLRGRKGRALHQSLATDGEDERAEDPSSYLSSSSSSPPFPPSPLLDGEELTNDAEFILDEFDLEESFAATTTIGPDRIYKLDEMQETQNEFRFGGVERLYNANTGQAQDDELLDRLRLSTVVVVGLGGVGSWAAEALCRSGIGHLILVDMDDICMSNSNRQLHTMSSTVGEFKIDVLAQRFQEINPLCRITCVHDFVSVENVNQLLGELRNRTRHSLDYTDYQSPTASVATTRNVDGDNNNILIASDITAVLDAMDGSREKSALLAACVDHQLPVYTCGGAAGRLDPTKIVVQDITRVRNDKLISVCRRELRKHYGFAQGLPFRKLQKQDEKAEQEQISNESTDDDNYDEGEETSNGKSNDIVVRPWNIPAIVSTEDLPTLTTSSTTTGGNSDDLSFRICDGDFGTACFVTGTFGFIAAAQIVTGIAQDNLHPPRRG